MTGENIDGGGVPVVYPEVSTKVKESLSPLAERLQKAIQEDSQLRDTLEKTLTEYLPAIKALKRISPDLGIDFGALQELAEQPPLEIARRVLYVIAQKFYTERVGDFYGREVTSSLIKKDQEEKREIPRAGCERKCSEWAGELLLRFGPEKADLMLMTKCSLREDKLSDQDLNLFVKLMVDMFPDRYPEILGKEGRELYHCSPRTVLKNFLDYGRYKLRKYFAQHLEKWKVVLRSFPASSQSKAEEKVNI